jgi:hypothetical protein
MTVEGLKTIFDWVAVILLFLTFAAGTGVLITGNIINRRQAAQLRQFDSDLTDAKTKLGEQQERAAKAEKALKDVANTAGDANERAGLANLRASRLEKEAEDERMARVKIEDAVAWRRLTKNQISEMGTSLAVFHQQLTALLYNVSDLEAYSFASDIDVALHEFARWNIGEPQSILMMREGPVNFGTNPPLERGVVVRSTSDAGSRAAALAVVENLSNLGFDAFVGEPIPNKIPTVQIFVQPRPEGPQGAAKRRAQHKTNQ